MPKFKAAALLISGLVLCFWLSATIWSAFLGEIYEFAGPYQVEKTPGFSKLEVLQQIAHQGQRLTLRVSPSANHFALHLPLFLILALYLRAKPFFWKRWLGCIGFVLIMQLGFLHFETLCHWDKAAEAYTQLNLTPLDLPPFSFKVADWWRLQGRFLTLALPFLAIVALSRSSNVPGKEYRGTK